MGSFIYVRFTIFTYRTRIGAVDIAVNFIGQSRRARCVELISIALVIYIIILIGRVPYQVHVY